MDKKKISAAPLQYIWQITVGQSRFERFSHPHNLLYLIATVAVDYGMAQQEMERVLHARYDTDPGLTGNEVVLKIEYLGMIENHKAL